MLSVLSSRAGLHIVAPGQKGSLDKAAASFAKAFFLSLFLLSIFPGWAFSAVTVQIMDLNFPENCGASKSEDISTCSLCHHRDRGEEGAEADGGGEKGAAPGFVAITSMEEADRITVSVPAKALVPGQPFRQEISINGPAFMFQYGYRKDHGPLNILDSKWIYDSPVTRFTEKHDGRSLPLLDDPGDYIFILKLLHDRHDDPHKAARWEEVVLLWTLSVLAGH